MPPDDTLQDIRNRTAQGMARLLRLGAVGGKRGDASSAVDVEMLLAPVEAMGGGVPDICADLLAEIAVDIVTMLHSSRAAVRAAVEPTSAEQKAILKALCTTRRG